MKIMCGGEGLKSYKARWV